jgi:heat shock protein HslJ
MKRSVWCLCLLLILSVAVIAPTSAQSSVTPTSLANMTYNSEFTESGTVTLMDGVYEDTAAQINVQLTDFVAMGELNGLSAAAVILATNTGGSGTFMELAVVQEQNGAPVHVASQMLGDRVQIDNLAIRDNEIVLLLTVQGLNNPFCCPTAPQEQHYQLEADNTTLTQTLVLALAGGPAAADVAIDTTGLEEDFVLTDAPSTPYDISQPPGPSGSPAHTVGAFNGDPRIWIFPVNDYTALWDAAGNPLISQTVMNLQTLLADQPVDPVPPLPILPPQSLNDVAAQVAYLDFGSGTGVRFVGRVTQSLNPVCGDRLTYYYQGLSSDNRYYVSVRYPITSTATPSCVDGIPQETLDQVNNNNAAYMAEATAALNAAAPSDFTPDLATLDAMAQSITINEPAAPTTTPINAPGLTDVVWQWQSVTDASGVETTVANPENYLLLFYDDGSLSVQLDCNGGGGSFTVDGTVLTIENIFSTMMYCGEQSLDHLFLTSLYQVTNYSILDGNLFLALADGGQMLLTPTSAPPVPAPINAPGLTGIVWQWQTMADADLVETTITNPESYTLLFNQDGTLNAQIDCNSASGSYTVDGTVLTIGPMATTMMFCGEASLDAQFGAALAQVTNYSILDGNLYLALAGGGNMIFAPAA